MLLWRVLYTWLGVRTSNSSSARGHYYLRVYIAGLRSASAVRYCYWLRPWLGVAGGGCGATPLDVPPTALGRQGVDTWANH